MKINTKEIVIKSIEFLDSYKTASGKIEYLYEIETNQELNLDVFQNVITQSIKNSENLDEWMEVNGVGKSEIVEFLNNNYKKQ